jgi:DNA-directed RNA polymerase I, II, and III subunit RPABC5
MIIPVRCFTCGKVMANKWEYFRSEVKKRKEQRNIPEYKDVYVSGNNVQSSPEKEVLDKLKLKRMCCRRHILTHVEKIMDTKL